MKALIAVGVLAFAVQARAQETMGGSPFSYNREDAVNYQNPKIMQACQVAAAARLSLSSMYGSCDAANTPKGGALPMQDICGASSTKSDFPDLATVYSSAKPPDGAMGCSKTPQKPHYSQEGDRMTQQREVDPAPDSKTDCSGFVSGVLARLGMKFTSDKDPGLMTTAEMVKDIEKPSSCFQKVEGGILPGDLVVYNDGGKGHVYLIDRVTMGPSCNYSIIESSGGSDGQFGGPRVVSKTKGSGSQSMPSDNVVGDDVGAAGYSLGEDCINKNGKDLKIVRFNGEEKCKAKPKMYKNEQCVASCDQGKGKMPEASFNGGG